MTLAGADFDLLYRKHAPGAFLRARRMLGNDADAHEVVHDLFLSLLQAPEQFAGRSSVTAFMYQAITHACLNRLRNQRTRARILQLQAQAPADAAQAHHRLHPERLATLFSELQRMPENLATVAVYYYLDGLTHDEIARLLSCSARHVGNLVARVHGWSNQEANA